MTDNQIISGRDPTVVPEGTRIPPLRIRHRILQAGGWVMTGFVVDKVIAMAQLMIVARLLTPADFGLMAASAAVLLALLTVGELGLEPALIARQEVRDDDLAVAWTLTTGRGVVLALLLWLCADLIGQLMHMPQLASLLRVHALALVIQGVQSPALALLSRNLDVRRRVTIDVVRRVIETGAIIALALWLRNVWALLGGQLVGLLTGSLLSFWVAPFRPRLSWDRPALAGFLRYGKHLNPTGLFIFGVMSGGEFVIGRLLGPEALGLYQVALAIPLLLGVRATVVIHQLSLPTYAMLRDDRSGVTRVFKLQMGLVGLVFIPLAVGVALLAPFIVPVLFGPQWTAIIDPLRILCVYAVCAGCMSVMASLHYGADRPELQMRSWGIQLTLFAVLILPLTTRFGIAGAAAALAASYVLGVFVQAGATWRLIGADTKASFASLGWTCLIAASLVWLVLVIAQSQPEPMAQGILLFSVAAGTALYACYLWWVEYPRLKELWRMN